MSETLVKIAPVDTFREGKGYTFIVENEEIAVFYTQGRFFAVSNVCPHQHVPLIAEGELCDLIVTCPMHGWKYHLETGKGIEAAGAICTYETSIDKGNLYIRYTKNDEQPWW